MADKERNALIPSPAGGLENIGSGPKSILSGMVSDALVLARAREKFIVSLQGCLNGREVVGLSRNFIDEIASNETAGSSSAINQKFSGYLNWTEEEIHDVTPLVCKLIAEAMELGIVAFPQAAFHVRECIASIFNRQKADAIPFNLVQGVYFGLSPRFKDKGATPKTEVVKFESFDELGKKPQ